MFLLRSDPNGTGPFGSMVTPTIASSNTRFSVGEINYFPSLKCTQTPQIIY